MKENIYYHGVSRIASISPKSQSNASLVPRLFIYTRDLIYAKLLCKGDRESLGGFDHVLTLMTRSVSIVSMYVSP